jgi:DNA-binding transcriptional LysR family regulator
VDVAVAVGPLEDSEMVSRTLMSGPLVWVCSAKYAAAHPIGDNVDDLTPHIQIVEKRYANARQPVHVNGVLARIDLERGIHHVSTPLVVRRAVMDGAGIGLMPLHYCGEQLADGTLIEVFKHITFDSSASTLTLVYPSRRHVSPRLRAFIDFLTEAGR